MPLKEEGAKLNLGPLKDILRSFAHDFYSSLNPPIRLISHLDADGLSSAGVLISLLRKLNISFHLSIVKYLNEPLIKSLRQESYATYIFSDLGSGDIELLSTLSSSRKRIFIVDHHKPSSLDNEVNVLNPFLAGLNGDIEISGAGMSFLLYYEMLGDPSMAPISLVGALGDLQEKEGNGFMGINKEILNLAIREGYVEVRPDLKLFGGPNYPLVSSLERTVDPLIEGISDSSSGALTLVEKLGIPIKIGDRWTTLSDLTEEQKRDLANELVKRVGSLEKAKYLIGNVYIYLKEPKGSPLRDLSSFATLLNACGRMGGGNVGALLASGLREGTLARAMEFLQLYRRTLSEVLRRVKVRISGRVAFIDEGQARDTMIGTIASILSKSFKNADVIIGYANSDEGIIKISARLTKSGSDRLIDLDELLRMASKEAGGVGGGHKMAAGAQIPRERKEIFEKALFSYLEG